MKNKTATLLVVIGAVVGFVAGGVPGCGSSSSGSITPAQRQDLCNKVCDKLGTCTPELAPFVGQCKTSCMNTSTADAGSNPQTAACAGDSANIDKANACLAKPCDQYSACLAAICPTTGGTGGANGGTGGLAGGTGGKAGGSGGASAGSGGTAGGTDGGSTAGCEACGKFDECCVAIITAAGVGDPKQCNTATSCAMADASSRDNVAMACQMNLQTFAMLPTAPAACK